MNPKWPVFIPSKGRWRTPLTAKAFDRIGVPYRIVVQPQEADAYRSANLAGKVILLPPGLDGLVPTRNWIWDLAAAEGHERFWTFDDNIQGLYRLNRNLKVPVGDGTTMLACEEFTERWENVIISGMNYFMFAPRKAAVPPLYLNTRVYSNMLILTDARDAFGKPYRNVGVYNDDTELCLRALKDGWCTVLFNAFLIFKMTTMKVQGGMTPQYQGDGRLLMAQELQRRHPDVVKVTRKWGRWQHHVDYRPFAKNRLRPRPGITVQPGTDDMGMSLQRLSEGGWQPAGRGPVSPGEDECLSVQEAAAEEPSVAGGADAASAAMAVLPSDPDAPERAFPRPGVRLTAKPKRL